MTSNSESKSVLRETGTNALYLVGIVFFGLTLDRFLPSDFAWAIAMFLVSLIGYPLFVRGTVNGWAKDKRKWTFWTYMLPTLVFTIVMFLVVRLILLLTPQL
jgi:hypothetical protein